MTITDGAAGTAEDLASPTPASAGSTAGGGYLRALGPGLVTGASDDDPSGIATYSQAGATFGFGMLWTALLTFPLMAGVQEICDRTALATGRSLGTLAVERFARVGRVVVGVLVVALIVANTLNIAADLVAIGAGMNLLHAGPTWTWALLSGGLVTLLVVSGSFDSIARVFKVLCLSLLSYLLVLVTVNVPWSKVALHTFVPDVRFDKDYIALLVAVLGTTISPYLFFWQNLHRLEDMRTEPEGGDRAVALKRRHFRAARRKQNTSRFDVFSGMAFSNVVMFAVIAATAVTLKGHNDIQSAAEAARALGPVAGGWASTLFALGFIGSGFLAVPVLAGSGAAGMAGLLRGPVGFSRSPRRAPVFYVLVVVGTLGGTVLSLLGVNPIRLLVFVAILNGVAAGPFLIVVMLVSSSRSIMGRYVNGLPARVIGWTATALMVAAAAALFATGGGL
ncbi:MAG: Nramp family divalent metal transporter [Acidimicrobiales bacterium]